MKNKENGKKQVSHQVSQKEFCLLDIFGLLGAKAIIGGKEDRGLLPISVQSGESHLNE